MFFSISNFKMIFLVGTTASVVLAIWSIFTFDLFQHREDPYRLEGITPFSEVWLAEDDEAVHVSLVLVFPYGERANPYELGLAHYVEHLAWHNVRHESANQGRHSNAWTSAASTGYWLTVDPSEVSDAVDRLMSTAKPLQISAQNALQERDIVTREYDLRVVENPFADLHTEMVEVLYGGSSYARPVIGTRESITKYTFEGAKQLHRDSHRLDEAKLLISGPIERASIEKLLEGLPKQAALEASSDLSITDPTLSPSTDIQHASIVGAPERRIIGRSVVTVPNGLTALTLEALLETTNKMMLSTKPSGLSKSLLFDEFWARSLHFNVSQSGPKLLETYLTAVPEREVHLEDLKREVEKVLLNARTNVSEADFKSVKSRLMNDVDSDMRKPQTNMKRLRTATSSGTAYSSVKAYRKALNRLTFKNYIDFQMHLHQAPRTSMRMITPNNK